MQTKMSLGEVKAYQSSERSGTEEINSVTAIKGRGH